MEIVYFLSVNFKPNSCETSEMRWLWQMSRNPMQKHLHVGMKLVLSDRIQCLDLSSLTSLDVFYPHRKENQCFASTVVSACELRATT